MRAVIPVRDGILPAGALETIAECGGRAVLVGSGTAAAALATTGVVGDLLTVEMGHFAPARWAVTLAEHPALALADDAQIVMPASPDGRDLAPRLAAALHRTLYAAAMSVTPHHVEVVRRGGHAIIDIYPDAPFVATLQPGVRGVETAAGTPTIRAVDAALADATATATTDAVVLETLAPDAATMDLAESPRILGGGAGLASSGSFDRLGQLATALDASMGATRVITDRGWIGHERQIGTTGVVVDPRLYIAFGISGAVQHTSGLGQPEHIISINTDPHCPMMQLADLAVVSDADGVLTQLLARVATGPSS